MESNAERLEIILKEQGFSCALFKDIGVFKFERAKCKRIALIGPRELSTLKKKVKGWMDTGYFKQ